MSEQPPIGISGPGAAEQAAAESLARAAQSNPANEGASATPLPPQRRRVPLSVPRRKLEVAPIPGYVLYWFLEKDVVSALEGGYQFVDRGEVRLNQNGVANSTDDSGNTDLGSRVSALGNRADEQGHPERHVLMKIHEAWWKEDHQVMDADNAAVVDAIFGPEHRVLGNPSSNHNDSGTTYVKQADLIPGGRPARTMAPGKGAILNRGLAKRT